ncbi:MATE efflux family protein [Perilla frutescens var. hirtella]|uniref:Protein DETOXIFICATION n=1 Tax=Perilla frutescens var. hirtella TaxID=608512 RepID=A0AAD4J6A6_PERFH|nr:MATE efflux family protein [Perilla frutescens var. hirtella]
MEQSAPETNQPPPPSFLSPKLPEILSLTSLHSELQTQWRITVPLVAMNFTWFAKTAITTAFLGRLGELPLAGATLGFTFGNVTGFSLLNGLCGAMEPICGQAFGAKNFRLLHKTLIMATSLLLAASLPIAFLWLNVDKILISCGQQRDIAVVAKQYLIYLLPDLVVTSFLCPLKAYLSTQNITVPIMLSSAVAVALHVPASFILGRARGLEGISMAVWISDLSMVVVLGLYVIVSEQRKGGKWKEGGWFEQGVGEWRRLVKLAGPCCLTTCLEWWCYEILVLLAGRLPSARRSVGVLAIVLNFDYLLFSVMLSLATCASVRVSNEVGAGRPRTAYRAACVCLSVGVVGGFLGGAAMATAGGLWGPLYSREEGMRRSVRKMMRLMAAVEVVNFPLAVCGGVVRGTARPWLGMYANVCGFYLVALPLGVALAFKMGLGLGGLLVGLMGGVVVCLVLVLVFLARIDWVDECHKAQILIDDDHNQNQNPKPLCDVAL